MMMIHSLPSCITMKKGAVRCYMGLTQCGPEEMLPVQDRSGHYPLNAVLI